MKRHKRLTMTLLGLAAASSAALAGDDPVMPPADPPAGGGCDWCKCLDKFGEPIYENEDAMLIQAVRFFGRAQFQYAYIDGDAFDDPSTPLVREGDDFSDTFDEIRRLRFGAEVQALKFFKIKANANFENDQTPSGGDRDIGYDSLDAATVTFDARKAFGGAGMDVLKVSYGRQKVKMGYEVHTSSKQIKTVERSAVANKIYPQRMTGGTVNLGKGKVSATVGVFSTDSSKEIADWSAGAAYYASVSAKIAESGKLVLDFMYNDANGDAKDNQVGDNVGMRLYEWAASLAYVASFGSWELLVNGTIGDNGDNSNDDRTGMFYGLVVMPSYWLIADKLEAVGRYALQVAEEDEGIRTNSRYIRRDHGGYVNSGRGDTHNSIYLGLNYYFCENKSKVMAGVEWDSLDTPDGDLDSITWWLAYRMYF